MHNIQIQSELVYSVLTPTSFVFNIASAYTEHQFTSNENLVVSPNDNYEWCSLNTNGSRGIRLNAQPGELKLQYRASVKLIPGVEQANELVEVMHAHLPVEVLPYLNPSRYCESDRLGNFAWKIFGQTPAGYSRVEAICTWVNQNIDYVSGSTDASSSACDVLLQREGVCRDFAHVSITLCRALGIPARYVSGYAVNLQPPDFHGFFEAYLGQQWYLFDATKMAPVSGLVRIGVGKDAADTSFASIVGQATLQSMMVSAVSTDPTQNLDPDDNAISTA
jgi:transglutaminase-like putative cysteine protease